MRFDKFSFGSIRIDGITRDYDVVIDGGEIRKRNKKPSKQFHDQFGHTPLSIEEDIPWKCEPCHRQMCPESQHSVSGAAHTWGVMYVTGPMAVVLTEVTAAPHELAGTGIRSAKGVVCAFTIRTRYY